MTICDLCEGRIDVASCRMELPHVKQAQGTLDLCMKCQSEIYLMIESLSKRAKPNPTPSPTKKGQKP